MRLHKLKVFASAIIVSSLCSVSSLVYAANLTFANDTNVDLTVRVNNICSNEFGVLVQHTEKVITDENLQKACKNNQSCFIEIFNDANCTGTKIEKIILDKNDGVVSLEGGDNNGAGNQYFWRANGFNLYVSNH